jgi:hypothetical protein
MRAGSPIPPGLEPVGEEGGGSRSAIGGEGSASAGGAKQDQAKTTKTIMFERPRGDKLVAGEAFEREFVMPRILPQASNLTALLGGKAVDSRPGAGAAAAASGAGASMAFDDDDDAAAFRRRKARGGPGGRGAPAGPPMVELTVFFPSAGNQKIKLRVLEIATVEQAMALVLKQYVTEGRKPELPAPVSDAFVMRCTEDDGTVDSDVPALDKSIPISKFAFSDGFALVPDPNFVPRKQATGGASAERNPALRRSTHGTVLLRIHLPHLATMMVKGTSGQTLKEILQDICGKRNLTMDEHCFVVHSEPSGGPGGPSPGGKDGDKDGRGEGGSQQATPGAGGADAKKISKDARTFALPLDTMVDALPSNELKVIPKETLAQKKKVYMDAPREPSKTSVDGSMENPSNHQTLLFMTDIAALQYREFEVIKINKHNSRDHRVMGIDGERIYNLVRSSGSLGKAKKGTKKQSRLIRDVEDCGPLPQPNKFFIQYKDVNGGANGDKYEYEIIDSSSRAEVIAKIKYLQNMAWEK